MVSIDPNATVDFAEATIVEMIHGQEEFWGNAAKYSGAGKLRIKINLQECVVPTEYNHLR